MTPDPATSPVAARAQARWIALLAAIGAWTALVPYFAKLIGLRVDVPGRVEVVDHVVPGIVIAALAGWLAWRAHSGPVLGTTAAGTVGGVCFLAGFWVAATHVPLIRDAADARESWGAALWHASTALPILAISLWMLFASGSGENGRA